MAQLQPIDMDRWPRRDHWRHFRDAVPCSFAVTVEVDVTELVRACRRHGSKVYPAQIWAVATVVNRHQEFRMALLDGLPAVWDVVHPAFTIFNPEQETFSAVWTPYVDDAAAFSAAADRLVQQYRGSSAVDPQGDRPPNAFDLSSLPWTNFTAFSLQTRTGGEHLLPIFTLGRFTSRGDDRSIMPLAIQIDHAAADGFHVARLVHDLQRLCDDAGDWVR